MSRRKYARVVGEFIVVHMISRELIWIRKSLWEFIRTDDDSLEEFMRVHNNSEEFLRIHESL